MDFDLNPVWESLQKFHVLLLIRCNADPSLPGSGGYDVAKFEEAATVIKSFFHTIVKEDYGLVDMKMQNNAWLCIRPLIAMPSVAPPSNMKVLMLSAESW